MSENAYIVLRRLSRKREAQEMGDYEYFCGHRKRGWLWWRRSRAHWEAYHMPQDDGLYRFATTAIVENYIYEHNDMGFPVGEQIELVPVVKKGE